MTLKGVMAVISHYFTEIWTFRANYVIAVEVRSVRV